ncbi:integrase catalytic domain-containing protein [Trichonephila clavipes]|nr:integrase catalytic domain-containing protein [Trichonephila clavipes]
MNDLLTGADDLESGRKLQVQLVSMLKGAGMELHKWSANNPLLLTDSMSQVKDLSYSSSTETKTLGLFWKTDPDSFAFKIPPMTSNCDNFIVTKKSVISTIARIFDPLGLIGPVITRAKILLQSVWQFKLNWNDPLPSNLVSYWKSFIDALESIDCLDIPRYCLQDKSIRTELHGFSDSSEKAYGAALYLRCINTSGQISVRLLCSKSKVAPLKSITIPRLELWAAVLLSKLLKRTLDAFKVNISQIYLWTDSSIVLAWIKKPLAQLKTFVRNRLSIIQELTESDFWKHVNSENNPADILSRGISRDKIQHCELWWFGPPFLHQYKELEPYDITAVEGDDLFLQELKETSDFPLCALLKNFEPLDIISNCSSFTKLQRVIAWCKRFIENAGHPMSRTMGPSKIKAIHLEIVSDLTTEAFLAALKWFVARRGRPLEIHSDNGRNFVGANNELRKILKALSKGKMEKVMDFLSKEQIKWNFNPHSAPLFDGLWEAGVKSLKFHLKRVIGNSILSHEEFLTLVAQIEAVLNSRPICHLSNDPNDVETLTPAHFLVKSSLFAVPDPDYTEIPMNRLSRWQLVQRMNQHFWCKWSSEYLNRLQQRPKWCKGNVGFKEMNLVLENSDSLK